MNDCSRVSVLNVYCTAWSGIVPRTSVVVQAVIAMHVKARLIFADDGMLITATL